MLNVSQCHAARGLHAEPIQFGPLRKIRRFPSHTLYSAGDFDGSHAMSPARIICLHQAESTRAGLFESRDLTPENAATRLSDFAALPGAGGG